MNRLIVAAIRCLLTFTLPTSKAKKATLLVFSVAMLLAGGAAAVRGQSALDSFDPNANQQVRAIVVQPDGQILIGGVFTTLSPNGGPPVTRNYIARLNPDGTLDTAFNANFNPNANTWVNAIAVQSDGKILVGGQFFNEPIGGQTRNNIARLNPDGTLDTAFNPNANNDVYTIAVQADGKALVDGDFSSIGGQTRNDIARLDPMTGLADSFNPNPSGSLRGPQVFSIAVQADGKILVGGIFTSVGGKTRYNIARLDPMTGLADSFAPNPMGPRGQVGSIAVQADGKVLVGGIFTHIRRQMRNDIARLDPTTGLADSFNPNANSFVGSIAVQADGKVLVGGGFTSIGGQPRTYIALLDATTGLADSFNPNPNGTVEAIVVQADGKILVGGAFTSIGGQTRNRIARLDATTGD
jgi:uncharacterized delta-60 repeat protein